MDRNDRSNLEFLLSTYEQGDQAVKDWMESVSQEDLEYALELLLDYRAQKEHFENIINQYFE